MAFSKSAIAQAIGVGVAAGAIVASTSGLITQPWYFPNGQKIEFTLIPHPFIIGFFASFVCAFLAWGGTKLFIWLIRKRR